MGKRTLNRAINKITPSDYKTLDDEAKGRLHRRAAQANCKLIKRIFSDPAVYWVLICGAPGKAVAQGTRNLNLSDERIAAIEAEHGNVCFYYSRPDTIEEHPVTPKRMASKSHLYDLLRRMRDLSREGEKTLLKAERDALSLRSYGI